MFEFEIYAIHKADEWTYKHLNIFRNFENSFKQNQTERKFGSNVRRRRRRQYVGSYFCCSARNETLRTRIAYMIDTGIT